MKNELFVPLLANGRGNFIYVVPAWQCMVDEEVFISFYKGQHEFYKPFNEIFYCLN